ncbi:MAG: MotA/TolQ/ExbB proton channel family protein [Gammaproteobacteria bacterium]|nr:MotA/TolQ/ExbB proton channel family protein [Gammaproteobacteria bacterium]
MLEIIRAGGWVMYPIIACSIGAMAIVLERLWALRRGRVIPEDLVPTVWELIRRRQLTAAKIEEIREGSPLGRVLAAGLANRDHPRDVMKEAIEESGRQVVHDLERYLHMLSMIGAISPLLGLYGTVLGMIRTFTAITVSGVGDAAPLAGGIAEALITTAGGLSVAIPAVFFYYLLIGRVNSLVVRMEEEALKLVEVMHGEREK